AASGPVTRAQAAGQRLPLPPVPAQQVATGAPPEARQAALAAAAVLLVVAPDEAERVPPPGEPADGAPAAPRPVPGMLAPLVLPVEGEEGAVHARRRVAVSGVQPRLRVRRVSLALGEPEAGELTGRVLGARQVL